MGERGKPRSGHRRAAGPRRAGGEGQGHGHVAPDGAGDEHAAFADESEPRPTLRGPGEGRADRRRAAKRIKRRRRLRATREIPILIGTALLIALVLKTFLVQAFVIPSGSMEETIRIDDRVLVDKLTPWFGWEPSRGEVVVFKDPGGWLATEQAADSDDEGPFGIRHIRAALTWIGLLPSDDDQDLIKRVIGVGGDTVACCDAEGRVTVNGAPLDEPYLYPGNPPSQIEFEVTVPEGRIFVMGDHRSNSADSRYHLEDPGQGTVPVDSVVGRAVVIAWPFGHWQRLGGSDAFADVPEPGSGAVDARAAAGESVPGARKELAQLPTPVELPLVMGVVGLLRTRDGPQRSVRSDCGGCSGGRAIRLGRPGRASTTTGGRDARRGIPRCRGRLGGRRGRRRLGRGPRGSDG
ncbi:signal peptidase I [Streptomyces litchfieldiae]|uniref:Signal peptidase I n=1 Tax=Streptomyces litchfieldiae TaxID=3075543 RepID=A0ABU2MHT1_9ACTN|nr:signal peptidase I [Streptomyces sp. DSM 44938]MDT0341141.1 signal peptidase I [Streptomyces sp. DSM 44938]